jgi:hypothetical protein
MAQKINSRLIPLMTQKCFKINDLGGRRARANPLIYKNYLEYFVIFLSHFKVKTKKRHKSEKK